jgi:hypothetical protein
MHAAAPVLVDRAQHAPAFASRDAWRVAAYAPEHAATWDAFVRRARNGVFLFERAYMDYHADRFDDASLMLWHGDELRAVLPAHRTGHDWVSHGGLTFGGLVLHPGSGAQEVLDGMARVCEALHERGAARLVYKAMPHIFHTQPSEDDLYVLHRLGARTQRVDLCTTIDLERRPALAKGRRHALAKARRAGIEVRASAEMAPFWSLLGQTLARQHGITPTHRLDEIALLASRFGQIALHVAGRGDELLAGVLTYDYGSVLHTQYMAASPEGRETGALDAVVAHLIDAAAERGQRWFSFGVSSFDGGRQLNAGLTAQKEMFGGRSTVLQTLELPLAAGGHLA